MRKPVGIYQALVQDIFKNSFKITIPRTTNRQVKLGKRVDRNELQVSDLVFFKTGWNVRHVGIYMGDNDFLHASVSQGVMISSLNNVYWKSKYWQSRRVID
jgi:lipoprotein Spr/probable lipoprotein NlpC